MKLSLRRKFKGSRYTIGDLSIDGTFFCNTIEDIVRELPDSCPDTSRWIPCKCKEKVYARTAIPTGTYKITLEYSPKFKRKMPYLHGVPHFLGILIHWRNTEEDSATYNAYTAVCIEGFSAGHSQQEPARSQPHNVDSSWVAEVSTPHTAEGRG